LAFMPPALVLHPSKIRKWGTQNGCGVRRRSGAFCSADLCIDSRLRQADAVPARPRGTLMTWMLWLSGAATALLFAYLVYALLRAEDIE
jgi:K+-transporting ATPase KdpF subunit